jgi:peptide/nickel transport system ATP-binding protein
MKAELLAVRNLQVSFATDNGLARVLDRIRLDVGSGEVVGLVGESGCGKTTLARSILGILPVPPARVHGGEIVFGGENLLQKTQEQLNDEIRGRRITFIPQDPYGSFNPVFTVGTQMMELMTWKSPLLRDDPNAKRPRPFWPYPKARREQDRELILNVLRDVQMPEPEGVLRKYPHEFSGGQRQRLMIAMALLPKPDLIIADEPTTALDVTIQAQILLLLRQLVKERGISVLFTTHDLGTAHEICDRIMVMYAGQEMESAPVDAFFTHPSHPYTKRLLESLPRPDGEIIDIAGEIPALIDPPGGCRFHPRCSYATAECSTVRPEPDSVQNRHWVRCYHPLTGVDVPPRAPEHRADERP